MVGSCGSGTSAPSDLQDIKPGQVGCWGEQKSFMPFASFGSSSIEIIIDLGIQLLLFWIFFCELWPQKTFLQIVVLNVFFFVANFGSWILLQIVDRWKSSIVANYCSTTFSKFIFKITYSAYCCAGSFHSSSFCNECLALGQLFIFCNGSSRKTFFSLTNLAICLFGSGSTDLQDEQAASLGIKYL